MRKAMHIKYLDYEMYVERASTVKKFTEQRIAWGIDVGKEVQFNLVEVPDNFKFDNQLHVLYGLVLFPEEYMYVVDIIDDTMQNIVFAIENVVKSLEYIKLDEQVKNDITGLFSRIYQALSKHISFEAYCYEKDDPYIFDLFESLGVSLDVRTIIKDALLSLGAKV